MKWEEFDEVGNQISNENDISLKRSRRYDSTLYKDNF